MFVVLLVGSAALQPVQQLGRGHCDHCHCYYHYYYYYCYHCYYYYYYYYYYHCYYHWLVGGGRCLSLGEKVCRARANSFGSLAHWLLWLIGSLV